ncbi:hypothetical protein G8759_04800 [Spirosoma aureum]|uniref:Uncharacterized protein n=1 Tax=Spirosoma aureum TaxID=2692134 RepID=A0A6G9AHQ3_9BACT|nr:hypothetical protein [Spirosoma aureum]QIP11997.1 hypothetical protein G8759_04800 [Spirosoma aureum]
MNRYSISTVRRRKGRLSSLHCVLFIFHFSLLSAQTLTREQLTGTWVGVYTEWDTDALCPLPTYIRLDPDNTYLLGMTDGSAKAVRSTWAIHGDQVRLDTIHFAPRLITLKNDLLRIGRNYPMVFRRFKDIPLDSANTAWQLNGHVWQSDSLLLYCYANGKIALENPVSKQRTIHFWRLARFGTSLFLIAQGNQYTPDGNYKFLWQLSSLSSKQLQVLSWTNDAVVQKTFRLIRNLAPGDSCRPTGFQSCSNCFVRSFSEIGIGRTPSRYNLSQLLKKHYRPVNHTGQSGLIHVQFVVNCRGEQGMFTLSGSDNDYCPKTFDTQITDQLLAISRNYVATDQFLRADDQSGNRQHDVAVSFTVRLQEGKLTDILP